MSSVLVVDDRPDGRRALAEFLRHDGHAVYEATGVRDGLRLLRSSPCDAVVAVVRIESDGLDLLCHVKADAPEVEVILFTCSGYVGDAAHLIKLGAYDCVPIPGDPGQVLHIVRGAIDRHRHLTTLQRLSSTISAADRDIIAIDPKTRAVFARAVQVADANSTVLITGESGTGKEVVARAIHRYGERRSAQFVPINCGAMPETLIESELFGHKKGSFTGAFADHRGLIEGAEGGVLFLDEVGEMSPQMQVRLLRFLDSGEIRRVGDTNVRHVDVRVIAATNRTLEQEVAMGRIRRDLFYRLSVISLHVPPLRERREDIVELAYRHLHRIAARLNKAVRTISGEALSALQEYHWPGNVRELHNVVEGAVIVAPGDTITENDLPTALTMNESSIGGRAHLDEEDERRYLMATLERFGGNHTQAAAALGISRTTLWRKLRRLMHP